MLVNIACITVLNSTANFNVCHMSMRKQTAFIKGFGLSDMNISLSRFFFITCLPCLFIPALFDCSYIFITGM